VKATASAGVGPSAGGLVSQGRAKTGVVRDADHPPVDRRVDQSWQVFTGGRQDRYLRPPMIPLAQSLIRAGAAVNSWCRHGGRFRQGTIMPVPG